MRRKACKASVGSPRRDGVATCMGALCTSIDLAGTAQVRLLKWGGSGGGNTWRHFRNGWGEHMNKGAERWTQGAYLVGLPLSGLPFSPPPCALSFFVGNVPASLLRGE
ncbi:hypothetical protein BDN70DRAFT_888002 [Pholiota conissans]|uniref:Uncharacterized protein n=1 Tax=Pholiota conissans TaxID=109636 RepID=A0A9P6CLT6_9AGAR|nr:hypothetical protein BDN70DRAFT_888002 [Pholiota conissans]